MAKKNRNRETTPTEPAGDPNASNPPNPEDATSVAANADVVGGPRTPNPPAPDIPPQAPAARTVAITVPADDGKQKSNEEKLRKAFAKKVGDDYADLVDQVNVPRRTLATTNGGKYRILKGGVVQTLAGPVPPEIAAEEAEEAKEAEEALDK